MLQNFGTSSSKALRPLVVPPPGFMPGALYVAIIETTIQTTTPGDPSAPPTTVDSLGFFYQEKSTISPICGSLPAEPCLMGHYWSLLPPREPNKGTMPVYNALHHRDVLGYLRVAESVNLRSLSALIEADDNKVHSMKYMSAEIYVFNALERLRKHGFFQANMGLWNLENFVQELDYFRREWRNAGHRNKWHCPRPFADFTLIFFDSPFHWWVPSGAQGKNRERGGGGG